MDIDVLFFCKQTLICDYAIEILRSAFADDKIVIVRGNVGDKFEDDCSAYRPKYIISFLSPWILPKQVLNKALTAAINFHPGSVKYPGIGCYNFALYNSETEYGVVCHHMEPAVDTGAIIMSSNFAVHPSETVESLKLKSMIHCLLLFHKVIDLISVGKQLPKENLTWQRLPYTRAELDALCVISPDMDKKEIDSRIRATTYPGAPGPSVTIGGHEFGLAQQKNSPIV